MCAHTYVDAVVNIKHRGNGVYDTQYRIYIGQGDGADSVFKHWERLRESDTITPWTCM